MSVPPWSSPEGDAERRRGIPTRSEGTRETRTDRNVCPTIEELLGRFRGEGEVLFGRRSLKYLCNGNVLTTGFDAPGIDCVVLLRPTARAVATEPGELPEGDALKCVLDAAARRPRVGRRPGRDGSATPSSETAR